MWAQGRRALPSRLLGGARCLQDHVRVLDLYRLQEIGKDNLLRPSNLLLWSLRTWIQEIFLGRFGSPGTCISRLLRGTSKSGEILDSSPSPQRKVFFSRIPLILPDVHVVKLGGIAGLYFNLFGHISAGESTGIFGLILMCQHERTSIAQHRPQLIQPRGFGDVVIHTRFDAFVPHSRKSLSGDGYYLWSIREDSTNLPRASIPSMTGIPTFIRIRSYPLGHEPVLR
jgi:hypothetical protein